MTNEVETSSLAAEDQTTEETVTYLREQLAAAQERE
jgi:hypothetical protein